MLASVSATAHAAAAAPARASLPRALRRKAVAPLPLRGAGGRGLQPLRIAAAVLPLAPAARSLRNRQAAQLPAACAARGVAAGSVEDSGAQLLQQQMSAAWEAAAAAAAAAAAKDAAAPAANLTLRAEVDGTSARVQRDALAACSHVFKTALLDAPDAREMVLMGKSKAELDLLVAWLNQEHTFTMVRRAAYACAPALLVAAARLVARTTLYCACLQDLIA
jgi:hypothetical protein